MTVLFFRFVCKAIDNDREREYLLAMMAVSQRGTVTINAAWRPNNTKTANAVLVRARDLCTITNTEVRVRVHGTCLVAADVHPR